LLSKRASSSPPCIGEINRRTCEPRREVALNHVAIGGKGKGRQLAFEGEPSQFIDVITGACDTSDRLGKSAFAFAAIGATWFGPIACPNPKFSLT
jgi:hypothetical protein